MSGFRPKDLINEVKIRPGIYNKELLVHPRREHKHQLWMEVAEHLTPAEEWFAYTELEKVARMDEISNKWKHMKDHFYREIKLQEAGEAHKKRKYIYFDDMEFVRPFVGYKLQPIKRKRKSLDTSDCSQDFVDNDADIDMDAYLKSCDNEEEEDDEGNNKSSSQEQPSHAKRVVKPAPKVAQTKPTTKNSSETVKKTSGITNPSFKVRDGDISFSLSLVPTLRKLGDSRKLSAKIEILKILHRYVDHIERRNLITRSSVSNNNNKANQHTDIEDEMDEDHLEEYEEGVNVKQEQRDDPLTGNGDGKKSKNTWWT